MNNHVHKGGLAETPWFSEAIHVIADKDKVWVCLIFFPLVLK